MSVASSKVAEPHLLTHYHDGAVGSPLVEWHLHRTSRHPPIPDLDLERLTWFLDPGWSIAHPYSNPERRRQCATSNPPNSIGVRIDLLALSGNPLVCNPKACPDSRGASLLQLFDRRVSDEVVLLVRADSKVEPSLNRRRVLVDVVPVETHAGL